MATHVWRGRLNSGLPMKVLTAVWDAQAGDTRTGLHRMAAGEWAAYHYLKKVEAEAQGGGFSGEVSEAVRLAGVDLREAESFHNGIAVIWRVDAWKPIHSDAGLFHLVALLYLSELLLHNDDEFQACLDALKGSMSAAELTTLLQFGRCVGPKDLNGFRDADLAVDAIQKIAPKMSRPPLEYVEQIVRSSYCLSYPRRDRGPACATALNYIRQRITTAETPELLELFTRLERGVVDCYARETVVLSEADWEAYFEESFEAYSCDDEPAWGHLTVAEARRLLSALCDEGSLLTQLVIRRPPNSVFPSHLFVLYDCTSHARLWLLSARATALLPIYGPFPVTYKDVGRDWEKYLGSSRRSSKTRPGLLPDSVTRSVTAGADPISGVSHLDISSASDNGDSNGSASSAAVGTCYFTLTLCCQTPPSPVGSTFDESDAIRRTELAVLSSEIGFMERVPSLVERAARDEALYEYYDWHQSQSKARGTLLCVFKSPSCSRVKIPRIVTGGLTASHKLVTEFALDKPCAANMLSERLDSTLWYEPPSKLQYWLAEDASKLEKYCSLSEFLDPTRLRWG